MEPKRVPPDPEVLKISSEAMEILKICAKSAARVLEIATVPVIITGEMPDEIQMAKPGQILEGK